jgi:hypothetical protein
MGVAGPILTGFVRRWIRTHQPRAFRASEQDGRETTSLQGRFIKSLLHAENRILRNLEDAEFKHGLSGNLDLLLR